MRRILMSFDITQALVDFLRRWGELSPTSAAVLALVFVAGGLVPVPRTFLTLAAGVVYGMAAIPIIMPATTLGCLIAFLLARYLFAARLWRFVERKPKLARDHEGGRCRGLAHRRAVPPRLADPLDDPERDVRADADRAVALHLVDLRVHHPADHPLRLSRRDREGGAARRERRRQPRRHDRRRADVPGRGAADHPAGAREHARIWRAGRLPDWRAQLPFSP